MAEMRSGGVQGAQPANGLDTGGVPTGIVHVGRVRAASCELCTGETGLADDDLEAEISFDANRDVPWGVARGVENSYSVGDQFTVCSESEAIRFDVSPLGHGVELVGRHLKLGLADPDRSVGEQMVLPAVVEMQMGVDHGNHVPLVEPGARECARDRDHLGRVEPVDDRVTGSGAGGNDDDPVRMVDGVGADLTDSFRGSRMTVREANVAEVKLVHVGHCSDAGALVV